MVARGVYAGGGKPALMHVTDMCDGIARGTEGMNYSLLSRELICDMVEVRWRTQPLDAMVLLSSCDKAVPAHLMAAARMSDARCVHVPGGTMLEGPGMFTLEQVGTIYALFKRGQMSPDRYDFLRLSACPTEGCCGFFRCYDVGAVSYPGPPARSTHPRLETRLALRRRHVTSFASPKLHATFR
jgi:dihydroxy-acid dehydratase